MTIIQMKSDQIALRINDACLSSITCSSNVVRHVSISHSNQFTCVKQLRGNEEIPPYRENQLPREPNKSCLNKTKDWSPATKFTEQQECYF